MQKKAPETHASRSRAEVDFSAYRIGDPEEFGRNMLRLMEEGSKRHERLPRARPTARPAPTACRQRDDRGGQAVLGDRPATGPRIPAKLAEAQGALLRDYLQLPAPPRSA